MTASSPRPPATKARSSSRTGASPESLPVLVDRLRWDRRRHPCRGHREYSRVARGVAAIAEQTLTAGDPQGARALVPVLRTAVDRVTLALAHLDDSCGVIGQDLRDLMQVYARACCAAPPPPAPLAAWVPES
jgi:hypothetical protein